MFFVSAAFAFQPAPPPERTFQLFDVPKVTDPPAAIGFAVDPTGEQIGRVLDTSRLPMSLEALLRAYAGVRSGPDGQPWMAGGALTVAIDGVSLGDVGGISFSDRIPAPGTVPVGVRTWPGAR